MYINPHSYSEGVEGKKVAVLGPLPPPLGGVAVHVQRVIAKLAAQGNCVAHFETVVEYRYRFFWWYAVRLVWFLVTFRPDYLYFHTLYLSNGFLELRLLLLLKKFFGFSITLIEHDCRYMYHQSPRVIARLNKALAAVDMLVCIGNLTELSYRQNGIVMPVQYRCESAFLPPDLSRAAAIEATYPTAMNEFLSRYRTIIVANAFQLSLINGKDLYGFDLLLHALPQILSVHPDVGLVLVLGQIGNKHHFQTLQQYIQQQKLTAHVYFLVGQKELWPLLQKSDIFVRPTLSDGASVSVEEALYFGKTVIASDACCRPSDAVLFKTGDLNDFTEKISQRIRVQHAVSTHHKCYHLHA